MWRNPVGLRLCALVLGLVAGGVVACSGGKGTTWPSATPQSAAEFAQLGGRRDFRICVDGEGTAAEREATAREALAAAVAQSDNAPDVYADPIIEQGCPDPGVLEMALDGDRLDYRERSTARDRSQFVGDEEGPDAPSPYRVFVYIVHSKTYSEAFGSEPYVSTAEEFVCRGICDAVTNALYVPDGARTDTLALGLRQVLILLTQREAEDHEYH